MQKQTLPQASSSHDEHILVLPRSVLFPHDAWQGIRPVDLNYYLSLIGNHQEFHPRSLMETDPTYKQIIPYLIFTYQQKFFLMQRHSQATETRLQNKFSFGIGGHIRAEDMHTQDSIIDWARREFHEEVLYQGKFSVELLGLLNDDSNSVGQVHAGFVFVLHGDSPSISIKSELKSGNLLSLDACQPFYGQMETWSQIVYTYLRNLSY